MNWLNVVTTLYGFFSIFTGLQGWLSKGSLPSLIAGGAFGILAIIGTAISAKNALVGYGLVTLVSLALIGRFLPAYLKDTGKIYPALVIVLVSLSVLICLICGHFACRCCSR